VSDEGMTQAGERTYAVSWLQALRFVGLIVVASLAPQLSSIVRGKSNASWPLTFGIFAAVGLATAVIGRFLVRVRVSPEGIRGTRGRLMRWQEVTEVEPERLLGGVVVRSTYTPSIVIAKSILVDPRFQQHVLELVPSEHLLAVKLRENQASPPYAPGR
jgi:Na+/melibiose symporter-like transporter